MASSSYHANRLLREAARDAPEAVKRAITRDLYVDDLMSGKQKAREAKNFILALHSHLLKYEMPIRKWASSDASIIAELPVELRQDELAFNIGDKDHVVKTLGLKWIPVTDMFIFTVDHVLPNQNHYKTVDVVRHFKDF